MIDCLEFRRRVGAEPFSSEQEVAAHRAGCAACARHQDELQSMDALIRRALEVDPARPAQLKPGRNRVPRSRLFALAASLIVAVGAGVLVFVSAPRAAIAREVVDHIRHEPAAMTSIAAVSAGELDEVLGPAGIRLKPEAGDVSYAMRCVFDGEVVPHLVVRTPQGPVTVLLLWHSSIDEPLRFEQKGYEGVLLPAPRGAIAVVGQGVEDLDAVARQVFEAVDWNA